MENTQRSVTGKRLYSAVQPTNALTIGNYIGAIRNMVALQDEYDCTYAIANMHAITVRQQPAQLRANTLSVLALYLACGIDPAKCTLYVQSHVPCHAELAWVLNTFTYVGEMERMTQFKDKSAKHADNINMGLMDYPVLMAADILLYNADVVPVGIDQRQHLEICRDIAVRFNNIYSPTFVVPEGVYPKVGAKISDLLDPSKKMSKSSENAAGTVFMNDDRDAIIRKFRRAVTDSEGVVRYDPEAKPGISNLLSIYTAFTGRSIAQAEAEFAGKGYGDFKSAVAETVADCLAPVQAEQARLLSDKQYLNSVLEEGARRAYKVASATLAKVYRKIGFYQL
ncbi:MAG TPA: tryptophan--tRNA ligase [Candidatus Coproplasma avistercoris]|nr:tryptophan--tRNA ligase [Candidatus Coproplasma avistercoris]